MASNWNKRMMDLAFTVASWSKDRSRKVGAVFFNPETKAVLSLGYNGFARGVDDEFHPRHDRPAKYRFTAHSEANGVYNAARHGICLAGSHVAVTLYPCSSCANAIVNSGAKTVITYEPDWANDRFAEDFAVSSVIFAEAGVEVVFLEEPATVKSCLAS